jgi:hypothetical protein
VYFFRRRGAALFTLLHNADSVTPVTIEEGLDAIRCEPDEPRVEFGPDFWAKYGALCTYTRAAQQDTTATQGWVARARNQLASLLANAPETRRQFIELLIEDIQYYGTLSERTLRKIAKPDVTSQDGLREIDKILDALKGELGLDYLATYKKTGVEDQVIITVEQQHDAAESQVDAGGPHTRATKELVACLQARTQAEVERLRAQGWTQADFARALRDLLQSQGGV